ncbi:MAG: PQQ-dependent sugar dehydrogenase, partial [Gemmataceae bacterium]
ALVAFPYKEGQTRLDGKGMKVLDLPAGGYNNHWTRNVVAGRDGSKLYVSVGSASNVSERGTAAVPGRLRLAVRAADAGGGRVADS